MGTNRIDPTPVSSVRIDSNETLGRVTPRSNFGERVKDSLANAGGAVAAGVGVAAQYIPGGAILSAALSGASTFANSASSGQSGARLGTYYTSGVVAGSGTGGAVPVPGSSTGGTVTPPSGGGGVQIPGAGSMPNPMDVLQAQAASNMQFLTLQNAMQQENQRFSTLSNVMKTRHDTASNTIRNLH